MIRRLLCLTLFMPLFMPLAGCGGDPIANDTATPLPRLIPPQAVSEAISEPSSVASPLPIPWPDPAIDCAHAVARPPSILCADKALLNLHRQLARIWQAERQTPDNARAAMLANQAYALDSEIRLCRDTLCVSRSYRRYLDAPQPVTDAPPAPTPAGTATPVETSAPRPTPRPDPVQPRSPDEPSCASRIGWAQAQYLARQCSQVNDWDDGTLCTPQRSCRALREQTRSGCAEHSHRPGFCSR